MDNITFSLEGLFDEIVEQGKGDAVTTEEGFHALVEDTIEEHRRLAEIHDDQNLEGYETQLKARWAEYQARLSQ